MMPLHEVWLVATAQTQVRRSQRFTLAMWHQFNAVVPVGQAGLRQVGHENALAVVAPGSHDLLRSFIPRLVLSFGAIRQVDQPHLKPSPSVTDSPDFRWGP